MAYYGIYWFGRGVLYKDIYLDPVLTVRINWVWHWKSGESKPKFPFFSISSICPEIQTRDAKHLIFFFYNSMYSFLYKLYYVPRSSEPFYIVSYYIKLVTTSWTHSIYILDIFSKNAVFVKRHAAPCVNKKCWDWFFLSSRPFSLDTRTNCP